MIVYLGLGVQIHGLEIENIRQRDMLLDAITEAIDKAKRDLRVGSEFADVFIEITEQAGELE